VHQVFHLLLEPVIGHDSDNLLIIGLINATVLVIVIRGWLSHELVVLECHLFRNLVDDGSIDEASRIDLRLRHKLEFRVGAARGRDDFAAAGQGFLG